MELSIFTIMCMVGRIHAGLWLDRRPWIPLATVALVLAALLRAGASTGLAWAQTLLWVSGLIWCAGFAVYTVMTWQTLTGPRSDGQQGCAEPLGRNAGAARRHGTEGC